jgi:hypothetical protein
VPLDESDHSHHIFRAHAAWEMRQRRGDGAIVGHRTSDIDAGYMTIVSPGMSAMNPPPGVLPISKRFQPDSSVSVTANR